MTFISHAFLCACIVKLNFGTSRSSSYNFSVGFPRIPLPTSAETTNATNQSSKVPPPNLELRRLKLLQLSQHQHHGRSHESGSEHFGDSRNFKDPESPLISNGSEVIGFFSGRRSPGSFPEFDDPRYVSSGRPITKRGRSEYSRMRTLDELTSTMRQYGVCCRVCVMLGLVMIVMTVVVAGWGNWNY